MTVSARASPLLNKQGTGLFCAVTPLLRCTPSILQSSASCSARSKGQCSCTAGVHDRPLKPLVSCCLQGSDLTVQNLGNGLSARSQHPEQAQPGSPRRPG